MNNGATAKKKASQVMDWGVEGRGGVTPFPSSHSLIKLHLLIDQFRMIKIHTWFKGWGSKTKEMNYSALNLNPLSPNSDQDQFSTNNIHTLSTDKL